MYSGSFGYDEKLPDNIREVFMWLCQDVASLHDKWDFYLKLFDKKNTELLSELARSSFQIIEESLRDDMAMLICRLSDPAHLGKGERARDNLSFPNLIERLENLDNVKESFDNLTEACTTLRKHRNKRVGHNDLKTKIKPKDNPLPGIGRKDIDRIIQLAEEILNCIYQQYVDCELGFEPNNIGGADDLVFWLQTAKEFDAMERNAMLSKKSK